jgi:hypothetical protein
VPGEYDWHGLARIYQISSEPHKQVQSSLQATKQLGVSSCLFKREQEAFPERFKDTAALAFIVG